MSVLNTEMDLISDYIEFILFYVPLKAEEALEVIQCENTLKMVFGGLGFLGFFFNSVPDNYSDFEVMGTLTQTLLKSTIP